MKTWQAMESDADLLHSACERENAAKRSDARWDRALFGTCVFIVVGLVAFVTWWLNVTPGVTP